MRKIIVTKNEQEESEEEISPKRRKDSEISPKRRRDSEISFGDTSSGYSSLSEQFAGIKSPLTSSTIIAFKSIGTFDL